MFDMPIKLRDSNSEVKIDIFNTEEVIKIKENNMNKTNLLDGLRDLKKDSTLVLKSDGLAEDEYICYIPGKGYYYEDGCKIGETPLEVLEVLMPQGWASTHNWYKENLESFHELEECEAL